jgi:hydroxymethylbilane synthase
MLMSGEHFTVDPMKSKRQIVRIGTRSSELAMRQSNLIKDLLLSHYPDIDFQLISMETIGDKVLDIALSKIGDKSLFTKELETALVAEEVDIVVHSLKDLPTILPDGLVIGCICSRESPQDAVLMSPAYRGYHLKDLPNGKTVGTSSVRRVAQLQRSYPHLNFVSIRGNLNTRLRKLDDPNGAANDGKGDGTVYDAIVLAQAGVERMQWKDRIDQILNNEDCLYAVGQGALAVECRGSDESILLLLSGIHDEEAALTSIAERSLMRALNGGCSTPIAVHCELQGDWAISLLASVLSVDGKECVNDKLTLPLPVKMPDLSSTSNDAMIKRKRDFSGNLKVYKENKTIVSPFGENCDYIGHDLVKLARDSNELYVGVKVAPICDIGRLRMACARKCGEDLAFKLLENGADVILKNIHATQIPLLSAPKRTAGTSSHDETIVV